MKRIRIKAFPTKILAWPSLGLGPSPVALIEYAVILPEISSLSRELPESMTNKSFFRFSFTSPPNTYISPSLPAVTLAACPNLGKGQTFLNLRMDHNGGAFGGAFAVPLMVEGESGGD